jgi:tetratricopeptide (TPR) repeat protein
MANFGVAMSEIYLPRLVWPWPLRIEHDFQAVTTLGDPRLLKALFVLVPVAAAVGLLSWKNRLCAAGAWWALAAFSPVAQVVPVPEAVAERFCYVPMIGVAMFASGGAQLLLSRSRVPPRALAVAALLVALLFGALDFRRSLDWTEDIRLNIANWESMKPASAKALEKLGGLYLLKAGREAQARRTDRAQGALDSAEAVLDQLLRLAPDNAEANRLMALVAFERKQRERAQSFAKKALELAPEDPRAVQTARAVGLQN